MRPACLAERDGNCPPPANRPLRRPLGLHLDDVLLNRCRPTTSRNFQLHKLHTASWSLRLVFSEAAEISPCACAELLQGPYEGSDVMVAEQPAGMPAAPGSAPAMGAGSVAGAAAGQPSTETAAPPNGTGPPAASSAAATAVLQPGSLPHTGSDPAAAAGTTGPADAAADAPGTSAVPAATATSAAAQPATAASAAGPGRLDTQASAMQPPPAKPKPSLLDTLLPQVPTGPRPHQRQRL